MTYSSVVSKDSLRVTLTIVALSYLDVLAFDIQNAYLTADCRERVWVVAGTDFGSKAENNILVIKAFYGLKRSGAVFTAFLAETLDALGYRTSYTKLDVWFLPEVNPDSFEYYEYILCYIDDVLCISHNPRKSMRMI